MQLQLTKFFKKIYRNPRHLAAGGLTMIELSLAGLFVMLLIFAGSNLLKSSQILYNYRSVKGTATDSVNVLQRQLRRLALTESDTGNLVKTDQISASPLLYRTLSFNAVKSSSVQTFSITTTCATISDGSLAAKINAQASSICPGMCSGSTVPNITISENGTPRTDLNRMLAERWFLGHVACFQNNATYPDIVAARIGVLIDTRKGYPELIHTVSQLGRLDSIQWID